MEMKFDHYTVRLAAMSDLPDYFHLIESNRKRLEDFFAGTVAMTKTLEETKRHLADVIAKAEKNNYFPFIIIDDRFQKVIGSIQIKSVDWSIPKGELGYYIDQQYEGKGVITAAVSLIIDFSFNQLGLNKLFIRTYEGNIGSRKIAEKNGFVVEGIIRCDYKTTSGWLIDTMYYGLLNPNLASRE